MKTNLVYTVIVFLLCLNSCYSQPGNAGMNPPGIEDRLKLVDKEICQPLKLGKSQSEKVSAAFKEFFVEMDKLVDKNANPPAKPEKSKIDVLAKKRDDKIKLVLSKDQFPTYLALEEASRPPMPNGQKPEHK